MRRLLALALALAAAGCGSPATKLFDLSPAHPPAAAGTAGPRRGPVIYVDPVKVAGYFDRTQMVIRTDDGRVSLHEFEVWSDPPAELIARAVVDDLAQRFGNDTVMATPAPSYAMADFRVQIDVLRFDVDEHGAAVLDARWTLVAGRADKLVATRRERVETHVADPTDPSQRVTALRAAVAELSARIGDAVAGARASAG
ncbi:MAG TPA: PqiC family protein [Acetobacteraceae bacterium]|jgi:hypothetical protein|nr:PqiC family protein [Acetobacteraceae bacterium]